MLSEKEFRRRISANLHFLYTHLERGKTLLSVYHLYVLSELYRLPPEAMWSELQAIDISRLREKQGP